MIINGQTLDLAFRGFKTVYTEAFDQAETHYDKIAMTVPSSSRDESYGWIGQFPQLREWVGPRHVKNLAAHGFTITNRTFESTVAVKRSDVEDDRLGIFKPMFGIGRINDVFSPSLETPAVGITGVALFFGADAQPGNFLCAVR